MVDSKSNPKAYQEFSAEITPLEASSQYVILWENYEPAIISMTTNQVCTLVLDDNSLEQLSEREFFYFRFVKKGADIFPSDDTASLSELSDLPDLKKSRSRSQDDQLVGKSENLSKGASALNSKKPSRKEKVNHKSIDNHRKQSLEMPENKAKVSFDQKAKEKNGFKAAEELSVKKKKSLRHLKIELKKSRVLRLRFKYYPEFITPGQKIFVNDSTMKAIGIIKELHA